jgi:cytochrome c553
VLGVSWKSAARCLAIAAGLLAAAGTLFVLSGIYNFAASVLHFEVTEKLIQIGVRRSVQLHSRGIGVPDLEEPGLVPLGASHFQLGCAPCHGSPREPQNPIVAAMYPRPPALSDAATEWEPEELFWIVKHGIKASGMPAWSGRERDREAWALVAFIQHLPGMTAAEYETMTGAGPGRGPGLPTVELAQPEPESAALCVPCHGDEARPPIGPLVPALQGQKLAYLIRSMHEYRGNERQSGMMEPIAGALGPEAAEAVARKYATAARPSPDRAAPEPASARRGREIAARGIPEAQVPPCLACHSPTTAETFPLLDGLAQGYLREQLMLFRSGVRSGTGYAAIMATIAPRLTAAEIEDVTAYFASLDVGSPAQAAGQGASP